MVATGKRAWTPFGHLWLCPRCGSAPRLPWPAAPRGRYAGSVWQVVCPVCGHSGPFREHPSAARDAWNIEALEGEGGDQA